MTSLVGVANVAWGLVNLVTKNLHEN